MTLRCALYARYSSDQQSAASIEDQFRICRERAEREGWKVVGTYKDSAISGDSVILRPGVQALLEDARRGAFEIVVAEVPELRIVDDALWQAAKARQGEITEQYAAVIEATQSARANRLNSTHRPRYLLSGLLECGVCGGSYAKRGQDRYGCSSHVMSGSCSNSRTVRRVEIEERVPAGLRDKLMEPEAAAEAMKAYVEETNRLNRERRASGATDRAELAELDRKIKAMVAVIEDGGYARGMLDRMRELEARQDELNERLAAVPADIPDIHPNIAIVYRRKVERLAAALADPRDRDEAADAIRG